MAPDHDSNPLSVSDTGLELARRVSLCSSVEVMLASFVALAGLTTAVRPAFAQASRPDPIPWSFVVLGHIRGWDSSLHPRLAELLADVRRTQPAVVLLAGDQVWGDTEHSPRRREVVVREWNELDSALATLHAPVVRAPGNHDINDRVTRDVYRERYGLPPMSVVVRDVRFLVLNSAWTPTDADTAESRNIRGVSIDSSQIAWLRTELPRQGPYRHSFVLMHHLLWWGADTNGWWREVHPLLRVARVRAVFTGDHGPLKYSHLSRDGIDYYQTSIGGDPPLVMLRNREFNRVLEAQLDNFLAVSVAGDSVAVTVATTGASSTERFTPEWHASAYQWTPPAPTLGERLRRVIESPARMAALVGFALVSAIAGFLVRGWRDRIRR